MDKWLTLWPTVEKAMREESKIADERADLGGSSASGSRRLRSLVVVGMVSSCVAIGLLIAAVDPSRTLAVLRQARPGPLVLAVGILAVQVVVRTVR